MCSVWEKIWQCTDIKGHILTNHKGLSGYASNRVKNMKESREKIKNFMSENVINSCHLKLEDEIKTNA
jgi:hypothetical protein